MKGWLKNPVCGLLVTVFLIGLLCGDARAVTSAQERVERLASQSRGARTRFAVGASILSAVVLVSALQLDETQPAGRLSKGLALLAGPIALVVGVTQLFYKTPLEADVERIKRSGESEIKKEQLCLEAFRKYAEEVRLIREGKLSDNLFHSLLSFPFDESSIEREWQDYKIEHDVNE